MGGDLAAYYSEHRSLLGDARSQDAIKASHAGMMKILAEIDKYEIREKPTPPNGEDRRMGTDRRQD